MDFVTSHFGKMNQLNTFSTYLSSLLGGFAIAPPKSEDKYVEKVFNRSEVHLSEIFPYFSSSNIQVLMENLTMKIKVYLSP